MTISNSTNRQIHIGNALVSAYAVPFKFIQNDDISVQVLAIDGVTFATLSEGADYTLIGAGINGGGALTVLDPAAVFSVGTEQLWITRNVSLQQSTQYPENDNFPARRTEDDLDRGYMVMQQIDANQKQALKFPLPEVPSELPSIASRKDNILAFDSNGKPIASLSSGALQNLVDANSPDLILPTLGAVANNAAMAAILFTAVNEGDRVYNKSRIAQGDGAGGFFSATLTDISAKVTNDPAGGFTVPFASDPTGVSGGWTRDDMSVVNAAFFGAPGQGLVDETVAANAAIDWVSTRITGGEVYFNEGKYLVLGLAGKSNVKLTGPGKLYKNGGAASTHIIDVLGALTATTTTLSVNAVTGDDTITVVSVVGLSVGQWVNIDSLVFRYSTIAEFQEFVQIKSIASNNVTFDRPLLWNYGTASGSKITVFNPVQNFICELDCHIPVGTDGGGIYIDLGYKCFVQGGAHTGANDDASVWCMRSVDCHVRFVYIADGQNLTLGGYGYGVGFDRSSYGCTFTHSITRKIRENPMGGGAALCLMDHITCYFHKDNACNTHGTGAYGCKISNIYIYDCEGAGVTVGYSSSPYHDIGTVVHHIYGERVASNLISVASGAADHKKIRISDIDGVDCASNANKALVIVQNVSVLTLKAITGHSPKATEFIRLSNNTDVVVDGFRCDEILSGYGIRMTGNTDISISNGHLRNISSNFIWDLGGNTGVMRISNMDVAGGLVTFTDAWQEEGNSWNLQQRGSKSVAVAASSSGTVIVGFATAFDVAPVVIATAEDTLGNWTTMVSAITTTGFTIKIRDVDGTSRTGAVAVNWIAQS